jgi:alkylation response protein AidB-like acyl-CoA dehydrogenase
MDFTVAPVAPRAGGAGTEQPGHLAARDDLARFQERLQENFWLGQRDLAHTVRRRLTPEEFDRVDGELTAHGAALAAVQPQVAANDARTGYPQLEAYDAIGRRHDQVLHHGAYADVGDVIYGSRVVERLVRRGGLREGLAFHFLNCMLGEAGHNCPVICNFETARLLQALPHLGQAPQWVAGLLAPSYRGNLTASQFLTEVTGGSDVGANATVARPAGDGTWRVCGEKWFTSNADADLNVLTARYDPARPGTAGLSVFLVPRSLPDGSANTYTLRRLKDKLGTRALATAEIDYHDAWAVPLAPDVEQGFAVLMREVVHHSRIALAVSCVAMAARAYGVARAYADERRVFGRRVVEHALARENLAVIRCHVLAMQAGLWDLIDLQDRVDRGECADGQHALFIRLMANAYKQVTSQACVDHCHHALDTLGGNGTIETFSPVPRLLRDAVIEENWEGTHNTVRAQVLRDLLRYDVDAAYLAVLRRRAAELDDIEDAEAVARRLDGVERAAAAVRELTDDDVRHLRMTSFLQDIVNVAAWTALLCEAADQERSDGRVVKRQAAELFRRRFVDGSRPTYDDAERRAIDAVVEWPTRPRREASRRRSQPGGEVAPGSGEPDAA